MPENHFKNEKNNLLCLYPTSGVCSADHPNFKYYMWGTVEALQLKTEWSNYRIALNLGISLKFLRWCEGLVGDIHNNEIILTANERDKIQNILGT